MSDPLSQEPAVDQSDKKRVHERQAYDAAILIDRVHGNQSLAESAEKIRLLSFYECSHLLQILKKIVPK